MTMFVTAFVIFFILLFAGVPIPFFMLSGELMLKGGISRRLVDFAHSLIGHLTGGLGMVDILTSVIFAGISGSAAADTAAVGSIMIEPMKDRGYPDLHLHFTGWGVTKYGKA